jgi:hypothetical protein
VTEREPDFEDEKIRLWRDSRDEQAQPPERDET